MTRRDIIVIGGSSGAMVPLRVILGALPQDIPAAIFVVFHIPSRSLGLLAPVTSAAASLPVHATKDGMAISPGNIYLGVPDHHLILTEGRIQLGRGPRGNMARPTPRTRCRLHPLRQPEESPMMERQQIPAAMGELKLFGMKAAYDENIKVAVKRTYEPQQNKRISSNRSR
ncbi:CheB methylesterase [Methylorubrum salsuginis]|uniref:protein-glutamate methylesterase n=1 Tax=Methylorubrum salsuginis TaxID=414703 RepID=A0A1I4M3D9_9HYPH|nr:CheB methylesterase [Methylorubrum salsuginis]